MLNLDSLKTNLQLEIDGVVCPMPGGASVKVARIGNDNYRSLLRTKYKANRAVLELEDDLAEQMGIQVAIEVYARTILKDWKGISFDGVNETPFTVENAEKALAIKDFRERIKNYAEQMELYQGKAEESAVKS